MFIFSQSNNKLKIKVITSYISGCSDKSALIEDILTVECKIDGNKVHEINSDANFHGGFIKQRVASNIPYTIINRNKAMNNISWIWRCLICQTCLSKMICFWTTCLIMIALLLMTDRANRLPSHHAKQLLIYEISNLLINFKESLVWKKYAEYKVHILDELSQNQV